MSEKREKHNLGTRHPSSVVSNRGGARKDEISVTKLSFHDAKRRDRIIGLRTSHIFLLFRRYERIFTGTIPTCVLLAIIVVDT